MALARGRGARLASRARRVRGVAGKWPPAPAAAPRPCDSRGRHAVDPGADGPGRCRCGLVPGCDRPRRGKRAAADSAAGARPPAGRIRSGAVDRLGGRIQAAAGPLPGGHVVSARTIRRRHTAEGAARARYQGRGAMVAGAPCRRPSAALVAGWAAHRLPERRLRARRRGRRHRRLPYRQRRQGGTGLAAAGEIPGPRVRRS
jgi:hypothetical protein